MPDLVNGETIAQSMAESSGNDSGESGLGKDWIMASPMH
jgi:hypothetical protein